MTKQKVRTNSPLLILLYGFPGAGKTYFARNMTDSLEIAHLHSDKIRGELFEDPRFDEQEDSIVKHLMEYMCSEFLQAGVSVIYDTNAMRKSQRRALRELARKKGAKTLIVWFQIDPDTSLARLKVRDKRTSDDKYAVDYTNSEFKNYASKMQQPDPTEDYVVISGKHTFPSQKNAVFKKLLEQGYISSTGIQTTVAKPGMINLVPNRQPGRVDMNRRTINIR